jgi:serine phosphatase RsbU (regulator of sigma subunit)
MFEKGSIHQIMRQSPDATAREILSACFNRLNVFLGDRAPEDDVTLVVIRITKD